MAKEDTNRIDYTGKKWTKREQQEYSEIQQKVKCANCGYKFVLLNSSKQCPLCGNELWNKVGSRSTR